ncbi:MAG: 2'-deoxycytidine 5'-triphosphate deaminase, partial [Gemmatimonadota bacterium]
MTILSDTSLRALLDSGALVVEPLETDQLQPASIDLRLGDHFLKVDENRLDSIRLDGEVQYEELRQSQIVLPPHSFLLATTRERVHLPD